MRRPSAVSVRCAGGPAWHAVRVAVVALATATGTGWLAAQAWAVLDPATGGAGAEPAAWRLAEPAAVFAVAWALTVIGVGLGAWRRLRPRAVWLTWDGAAWRVAEPARSSPHRPMPDADGPDPSAPAGTLAVRLDLGRWMLLRWQRAGSAPRWLVASAAEAGPAWHAWRVAAYGTADGAGLDDDGTEAAAARRPPAGRHV